METRWEYLTPPELAKLAKEQQVCVLPIGVLERHGEHMPFGTDGLIAHEVCWRASRIEPCAVFPVYWFGQVHEASCFSGAVNLPGKLLYELLEAVLDQIAKSGFRKIAIVSGHGGNNDFLHFFAMSQLDREVDYTLYIVDVCGENVKNLPEDLFETKNGHAGEDECSRVMAVSPEGTVKPDQQIYPEPILPADTLPDLHGVHTGLWWYARYPENVTESPSHAGREKGEISLEARAKDVADGLRRVKADETVPRLQREFYARCRGVGK